MDENEKRETPLPQKFMTSLMFVTQLAWTIISPLVFCLAIGYLIDDKVGNSNRTYTLIGILVGLYCALRNGYTLLKGYIRDVNEKNAQRYKKDSNGNEK